MSDHSLVWEAIAWREESGEPERSWGLISFFFFFNKKMNTEPFKVLFCVFLFIKKNGIHFESCFFLG